MGRDMTNITLIPPVMISNDLILCDLYLQEHCRLVQVKANAQVSEMIADNCVIFVNVTIACNYNYRQLYSRENHL